MKREINTKSKNKKLSLYLTRELGVDEVDIEHQSFNHHDCWWRHENHIGVTATATKALSDKHINLEMISQGSSEVSVMFVTQTEQEKTSRPLFI